MTNLSEAATPLPLIEEVENILSRYDVDIMLSTDQGNVLRDELVDLLARRTTPRPLDAKPWPSSDGASSEVDHPYWMTREGTEGTPAPLDEGAVEALARPLEDALWRHIRTAGVPQLARIAARVALERSSGGVDAYALLADVLSLTREEAKAFALCRAYGAPPAGTEGEARLREALRQVRAKILPSTEVLGIIDAALSAPSGGE